MKDELINIDQRRYLAFDLCKVPEMSTDQHEAWWRQREGQQNGLRDDGSGGERDRTASGSGDPHQ
jgi:hypothetical protein